MSEFNLHELPDEDFESAPLDQLGMLVLRHIADNSEWNIYNALLSFRHQIMPNEEENQRTPTNVKDLVQPNKQFRKPLTGCSTMGF